ncbi:hypothetical protein P4U85_21315 [Brevibacillus laterosporus]|nr:hypothetical protein [Brevibacillus laterosporus]
MKKMRAERSLSWKKPHPAELWEKLITHSYELVFHKLPKKIQKELVK